MGGEAVDAAVATLKEWIAQSDNSVFFGGAGVSTESGIPDFRSVDGLYRQQYRFPPETILSHSFFQREPEEFFRFYRDKLVAKGAQPNAAHLRLAELERQGKLRAVITQNIDGLHQAAGSRRVIELHGSVHRCRCARCGRPYPEEFVNDSAGVPRCACGGVVRPEVVLYEEGLEERDLTDALRYIREAEVLIVGGTSLSVYPAAGLIDAYQGHRLALVNQGATSRDAQADLVIRGKIGEVFSQV